MLSLKKHLNLQLTNFIQPARHLNFSTVPTEDDELIAEIDNQAVVHDDNWNLDPAPDTVELEQFWNGVEHDIENDPEWIRFNED